MAQSSCYHCSRTPVQRCDIRGLPLLVESVVWGRGALPRGLKNRDRPIVDARTAPFRAQDMPQILHPLIAPLWPCRSVDHAQGVWDHPTWTRLEDNPRPLGQLPGSLALSHLGLSCASLDKRCATSFRQGIFTCCLLGGLPMACSFNVSPTVICRDIPHPDVGKKWSFSCPSNINERPQGLAVVSGLSQVHCQRLLPPRSDLLVGMRLPLPVQESTALRPLRSEAGRLGRIPFPTLSMCLIHTSLSQGCQLCGTPLPLGVCHHCED